MNKGQVTQGLEQAFFKEGHRIVFWYDPEQDYLNELDEFLLPDVQLINMQHESSLALKFKLELEDTQGKYLLYFPSPEPAVQDDWLLDIKLYSRSFFADRISIIFNELGLQRQGLRQHLQQRKAFLASKERIRRLQRWIQADIDDNAVDLAMIAVLVRAESCDIAGILYALSEACVQQNTGLDKNPESLQDIIKFDLLASLLKTLKMEVGYPTSAEKLNDALSFRFGHFLIRLLITDYCNAIAVTPDWAKPLLLNSNNARAASHALLSRWQDSARYYTVFDAISAWVAEALSIEQKLKDSRLQTLINANTFERIERQIIIDLSQTIAQAKQQDLQHFAEIIRKRLDGYWASRHKDDGKRRQYRLIYQALLAAIQLFNLRLTYADGFHFSDTKQLYEAYVNDLYQFDQAYRHYGVASQAAHVELLKALDNSVEQCYSQWYMDQLSRNWSDRIEAENRLAHWSIVGIPNQQDFYQHSVCKILDKGRNKRLVVIISDALRYEAAVELRKRINEKRYSEATLSTQLGVLPSYTTLGMAALLPHTRIEYQANGDTVLVDGQSTQGTVARNKILAHYKGMAITAEQVKAWSRQAGREALKNQQLVYVYHNMIDARGDSAATESETFTAVNEAIEDLTELSRRIMLHFNTTTILITADHGFLFQQSKLETVDRSSLVEKPKTGVLKSKKRYVIGHDLPSTKNVWAGSTQQTSGTATDTHFWIPKGAHRFHFIGGARFVHGGAMPQEIVVPILTVTQLRGKKVEKRTRRKVGVISTKSALKMVSHTQDFELIQTESVSEQRLAITVSAAIYEGNRRISSEEIVTFDCQTESISERKRTIQLSLSGTQFDRKKDYFLVIRDKDLDTEVERYPVSIDLVFDDDFF